MPKGILCFVPALLGDILFFFLIHTQHKLHIPNGDGSCNEIPCIASVSIHLLRRPSFFLTFIVLGTAASGLSEAVPQGYIHQSSHKRQTQCLPCRHRQAGTGTL